MHLLECLLELVAWPQVDVFSFEIQTKQSTHLHSLAHLSNRHHSKLTHIRAALQPFDHFRPGENAITVCVQGLKNLAHN